MKTEPDLSTATTDELWGELNSRFDSCIFLWSREPRGDANSGETEVEGWWSASISERLGLAQYAMTRFHQQLSDMVSRRNE